MLVTDEIEDSSFNNFFNKQNVLYENNEIGGDDELFSSIQFDAEMPMCTDFSFPIIPPESTDVIVCQNSQFSSNSSPTNSYPDESIINSPHSMDTDTLSDFPDLLTEANDLNFIDPDDFLNVDTKIDIKMDHCITSRRNTPSPSGSSGSSEFNGFYNFPLNNVVGTQNNPTILTQHIKKEVCNSNYVNILDTPPISPPTLTTIKQPLSPAQSIILNPAQPNQGIKIVQGTLIPLTTVPITKENKLAPMKKIKIQPLSSSNNGIMKIHNNKKTILLSPQDFSALVKNVSNSTDIKLETPQLIVKTKPIMKKETVVLPKSVPPLTPATPKPPPAINKVSLTSSSSLISKPNVLITKPSPPTPIKSNGISSHEIDERSFKKQQRMIKNRESACLSRKKKKEYVTSLENQISSLQTENNKLKNENTILREQLLQNKCLQCSCKNNNNINIISNNKNHKFLSNVMQPSAKKNTAVLLAVIFMVSINIGPFGKFFPGDTSMDSLPSENGLTNVHHSRNLLWIDESDYTNLSVPYYENDTSLNDKSNKNNNVYPVCPMFINQTESIRLASELRRWIGEPEYFNLSINKNLNLNENRPFNIRSVTELFDTTNLKGIKNVTPPPTKSVKPKRRLRSQKRNLVSSSSHQQYNDVEPYRQETNQFEVYNPSDSAIKYAEFFEEIRRRDDTFYVVSFSGDHLLLPALAHNKTLRPKMSLMLPTLVKNDSYSDDFVTLMQIDCEVINTSILRVRQNSIPENLRQNPNNTKSSDKTNDINKSEENHNDNKTRIKNIYPNDKNLTNNHNEKNIKNIYKPYFIDKAFERTKIKNIYHN